MKCPKCGGNLVYEEHVDGTYVYQIRNGVVDWASGAFEGECFGHTIRCAGCDFHKPAESMNEILEKSIG